MTTPSKREVYEGFIKAHINYSFIPEELKNTWVKASSTNPRKPFWEKEFTKEIKEGRLHSTSKLSNLARILHPTGIHICKACNSEASVYYVYPTKHTLKWINSKFTVSIIYSDTIFDIYEKIGDVSKEELFIGYFKKPIEALRNECYSDKYCGRELSPGVMANPPDRLDGFHCLNSICCRAKLDKGRSVENMKSYTRDRRAYELFSDGNTLLANAMMGKLNTIKSKCFVCKNELPMTADHIGPISLGFIHDPINFQACCSGCNSSKNNRLTAKDVSKLCALEKEGITIISWWAKQCWDAYKGKPASLIKHVLDKNTKRFLEILGWLKENKADIVKEFVETSYSDFSHSYTVKAINIDIEGKITFEHDKYESNKKTKHIQAKRSQEILVEKSKKLNRKQKVTLTPEEIAYLMTIDSSNFKENICKVLV
jgi:Alw26I/Eco31I/Esp3I family type II restriction endonuclease